jgi:hypothetical protein
LNLRRALSGGASLLLLLNACTFAPVRSAEVHPGPALRVQGSIASNPGEDAGWFWEADDCAGCSGPVRALDVGFSLGVAGTEQNRPSEWEVGLDGLTPYVGGYGQLQRGERSASGFGARFGIPWPVTWSHSQLYLRYDRLLDGGTRLLWNPALLVHAGNSPNGENPGVFVGLVNGVGVQLQGAFATLVPSAALVVGSRSRSSYGQSEGTSATVFGSAALSVTLHGRRADQ